LKRNGPSNPSQFIPPPLSAPLSAPLSNHLSTQLSTTLSNQLSAPLSAQLSAPLSNPLSNHLSNYPTWLNAAYHFRLSIPSIFPSYHLSLLGVRGLNHKGGSL
jgi:hypothetical protein